MLVSMSEIITYEICLVSVRARAIFNLRTTKYLGIM